MSKIEIVYVDHMGDDLTVVNSARVSFNKKKDILDEKDIKLIKYLAKHQHMTPFEHCTLTVIIKCPLYIRSQIHRHRTFAYNEVSRRYTSENLEFYQPDSFRIQHKTSKQCSAGDVSDETEKEAKLISKQIEDTCLKAYNDLVNMGVARELARGLLPQSLMTEFYMTGNLRNWVHFLNLRMDSHAQKEVQDVAQPITKILFEKFPESAQALMELEDGN